MNAARTACLLLVLGQVATAQGESEELSYARIVVAEVQPRCFASGRSPSYPDKLVEGQIVRVGKKVGGFRQVVLPQGVTGYVHKRFSSAPEQGMVTATKSNVSFRYRPRSSEVPALLMPQGSKLFLMGGKDEWWTVRNPEAKAYLAANEIQILETPNETLEQDYAKLEQARTDEWKAGVEARQAEVAAAAELERQRAELDALIGEFKAEGTKPLEQQDFAALTEKVAELLVHLPEDSAERLRGSALKREIERQTLVAQAVAVVSESVPTANVTGDILQPEVQDPLRRFDAVGWLRHEIPFRGPDRFTLEKGGKLLYVVTCSSGRYDLSLLDGVEVGVVGAKRRPNPDSVRELDAIKIEILRASRD